MARWLVKEEPEHYPYAQLERDGRTVWAGVKNPLAQKHLRSMRKGDMVLYYHTGREKAVVATARAASDPYPDPSNGSLVVIDLVPAQRLPRPVALATIKADPTFAACPLVRMGRLSVMPITDVEWARLQTLSGT